MALVDVVVVAYNSRDRLRGCVEPLLDAREINVIVVDNASPDRSLESVADLPVATIALDRNGGFGHGCNAGWRSGSATYVLFLNPDARIDAPALRRLVRVLEEEASVGVVGPKILNGEGTLDHSQRRFLRPATVWSQAFFLHRLVRCAWAEDIVRDDEAYARPASPDWLSGACMLLRRSTLDRLGGFDEGFFMYSEDQDLCRRARDLGLDVRYEPEAVVRHDGGGSAPRASLLPVLAASRSRYARKHLGQAAGLLARQGIAVGELTHAVVSRGGLAARAGHARGALAAVRS
jgi:N-acetylglucosaminyl-diphospho-decaprenol L-rhamnosyltransferase